MEFFSGLQEEHLCSCDLAEGIDGKVYPAFLLSASTIEMVSLQQNSVLFAIFLDPSIQDYLVHSLVQLVHIVLCAVVSFSI